VKIQPDLAIAHYNLVLCYRRLGERQLEREEERTLNLLDPSLAKQLRELTTSQFTVSVDDVAALRKRANLTFDGPLQSAAGEDAEGMNRGMNQMINRHPANARRPPALD